SSLPLPLRALHHLLLHLLLLLPLLPLRCPWRYHGRPWALSPTCPRRLHLLLPPRYRRSPRRPSSLLLLLLRPRLRPSGAPSRGPRRQQRPTVSPPLRRRQ